MENTANEQEKIDISNFTMRQPEKGNVFSGIMAFVSLFILCLVIFKMDYSNTNNVYGMLGSLPCMLIFPSIFFFRIRWKIKVTGKQITVTPFFGRKKTFTFDDITSVKHEYKTNQYAVKIEFITVYRGGEKMFTASELCQDMYKFIIRLVAEKIDIEYNEE